MSVHLTEDKERVRDFLREQNVGVLSTISKDGSPDSATIYFVVHDDLSLSFMTKTSTGKCKNIQRDERVALTVFEPKYQTTVQLKGIAKTVEDKSTQSKIYSMILKITMASTDDGMPPVTEIDGGEYIAFTIKPTNMRMAVFSRPEQGGHDEIFETVIS